MHFLQSTTLNSAVILLFSYFLTLLYKFLNIHVQNMIGRTSEFWLLVKVSASLDSGYQNYGPGSNAYQAPSLGQMT